MNLTEFVSKWNGKYIDTDNAYGGQCMDLMHQYCIEVLGLSQSILSSPCAKDVFNNFENVNGHDYFEKIINTPEAVPAEGDIVFWGSGSYGHVAIFFDGNILEFNSFDQNYPTGSPCHIQLHGYTNVLGWLRCKENQTLAVEKKVFENLVRKATAWDSVVKTIPESTDNETLVIAEINKFLGLEEALRQKDNQLSNANNKITELTNEISHLQEQIVGLTDDNKKLQDQVEKQTKEIYICSNQIKDLQGALESLKNSVTTPILTGWKKILFDFLKRF